MTESDSDLRSDYQRALTHRRSEDRQACPSVEAIEALVAGSQAESARLVALDHVMSCAGCQSEFELLRAIEAAGRPRRPTLSLQTYAIAAALVLVVGASFFFAIGRQQQPLLRGEPSGDRAPVPVAPRGDVEVAAAREFTWRPIPNATRYLVELLAPGGAVRAVGVATDTSWQLPDSVTLNRGEELEWWVRAEFPDGRQTRSSLTRVRLR
jgi:hypothetical protein